ncbi:unnamed protein product [Echinostoma caproni]|uniref:Tetraspanin n=1 Tax=Echinostoma caproni TaxID=27848 RepID=A0A183AB31_9TREM|nr:unnamed protein product [Echinostoma caproni]
MVVGGLMRWNENYLRSICNQALKFIHNHMEEKYSEIADKAITRIQEFAGPFGLALFVGGLIIVCVAGVAFVGLCCNIDFFMIAVLKYAHNELKNAVNNYVSIDKGDINTALLTIIMPSVGCCGYDGPADFNALDAHFSHIETVGNVTYTGIQYPVPCCDLAKELKDQQGFCPKTFTPENSFIQYGCKSRMEMELFDKVALGSLIVLLVIASVLALTIIYIKCS